MRFDPDCPWRHGCLPHDVAYRVSQIHHRERSAENRLARKVERLFADRRVCIAAIIPGLDATQKQVITVLKTTPEHWHSSVDPYSPLKAYVSVPTRYAVGKALRKQFRTVTPNGIRRNSVLQRCRNEWTNRINGCKDTIIKPTTTPSSTYCTKGQYTDSSRSALLSLPNSRYEFNPDAENRFSGRKR